MNLLKLTERTAHTLQCCEHLMADLGCEDHQRALAASVDALRKHPPVAPPVVVGLFNQCMAHADSVIRAIARAPTSPALDAMPHLAYPQAAARRCACSFPVLTRRRPPVRQLLLPTALLTATRVHQHVRPDEPRCESRMEGHR